MKISENIKNYKFTVFTVFIFLVVLTIILIEFNTDYYIIENKLSQKLKLNTLQHKIGTLFVGTHDYEHKDILISFNYFSQLNTKFYMLFADKTWNYLLEPTRPDNIEFIYVKEKTVDKLSSKLLLGENIIMFLYKESDSTGPYYILKNTKSPLIFFKIKKEQNEKELIMNHYNSSYSDIFMSNFLKKFTLQLKKINYKLITSQNPNIFMNYVKKTLYK